MKTTLLCCLLFVCLAQAQDSPKPNDNQSTVDEVSGGDRYSVLKLRPDGETVSAPDTFCAYIRAYRVKRESRGSDVMVPAGYTTCVPAKRFELRSAMETQMESSVDK
jgi:hypothetical protein